MTQDLDALPLPERTYATDTKYNYGDEDIRAARLEGYELAVREAQEGREPVYQVAMKRGATACAWIDTDSRTYKDAQLYGDTYRCRMLYTSPPPKSDEAMRKVLENVRACLREANECDNGPINDTIWFTPTETLFDYIDAALEAPKSSDAMDAQRYRLLRDFDSGMTELAICRWSEHGWVGEWVIEHDPDAAIDAAQAAQQKGKK